MSFRASPVSLHEHEHEHEHEHPSPSPSPSRPRTPFARDSRWSLNLTSELPGGAATSSVFMQKLQMRMYEYFDE
jgi:hypothetical protein